MTAIIGLMVAALAAWLIGVVYAVRFARAFWSWREREQVPHAIPVLDFLQGRPPSGDDTQDALREHGRRMAKIFIASGFSFLALTGLAIVIGSVAHL